jgi:hypothetical protein
MPNSGFDRTTFNGNIDGKFGKLVVSGQYTLEEEQTSFFLIHQVTPIYNNY